MNVNRNAMLGAISALFIAGLAALSFSGAGSGILLDPLGGVLDLVSGKLGISITLVLAFMLLFPLPFVMLSISHMLTEKIDYLYLAPCLVAVLVTLGLFGTSAISVSLALSILVAGLMIIRTSFYENSLYKKPMPSRITSLTMRRALHAVNFFLAAGVFVVLFQNPSYGENALNSALESTTGFSLDKISNLQQSALEQQKASVLALVDGVGQTMSVAVGPAVATQLPAAEAARCTAAVTAGMSTITKTAKAGISQQFATGEGAVSEAAKGQLSQVTQAVGLINILKDAYPIMTAVSVFMALQSVSIVFRTLAGFYSWIIWMILSRKLIADASSSSSSSSSSNPSSKEAAKSGNEGAGKKK